MYGCAKAASDMLFETLQMELASFNIRPLIINPGVYRTKIFGHIKKAKGGFSKDYAESAVGMGQQFLDQMAASPESLPGDADVFGQRLVELVDQTGEFADDVKDVKRVFMGKDALVLVEKKIEALQKQLEASRRIAVSAQIPDCEAPGVAALADYFTLA